MSTDITGPGPITVVEVQLPGGPPGPPGPSGPQGPPGASTLMELTDVTGTSGTNKSPVSDGTATFPLTAVTTQEDLDAILAAVAAVNWHTIGDPDQPPFWNDFTNIGTPWAPARYRLTLNNVVHIEGVIVRTQPLWAEDAGTVIFQLPVECLPGANLAFLVESGIGPSGLGPSISRIAVQSDGAVTWDGYVTIGEGAETFLSLCGINYSVGTSTSSVVANALNQLQ